MADSDKVVNVIRKKKIIGGHGGHHGGAWKVAFADFMTAMMAFFLVMWLMGSDEETKASVEAYFQGKAFDREGINTTGQLKGGDGRITIEGAQGRFEEKKLETPHFATPVNIEEQNILRDLADYFEGSAFTRDVEGDEVKYTLTPRVKFAPGQTALSNDEETRILMTKLTHIFSQHDGVIIIEAYSDSTQDWAMAYGRAISVRRYLEASGIAADKLVPVAGYVKSDNGKVIKLDMKDSGTARFIMKRIRK